MSTEYYFPAVRNGNLVIRAAFTCRCGKASCDGCINRENHLRSRNKEQRIIDADNASRQQVEIKDIAISAEVLQPTKPETKKPKAKRAPRKTQKKPVADNNGE